MTSKQSWVEILRTHVENRPRGKNFRSMLGDVRKIVPDIMSKIDQLAPDPSASAQQKIFDILNPEKIKTCDQGSTPSFANYHEGYRYCSRRCPCAVAAWKRSLVKNHGVDHPHKSRQVREKFRNTLQERYGSDNLNQAFHEQRAETNKHRYGTEYPLQSQHVRKKSSSSLESSLGVKYPFQSEKIRQRAQRTVEENHGVRSVLGLKENRDKALLAVQEKYGANSSFASNQVKAKVRKTMMDKYGVEHHSQSHIDPGRLEELHDKEKFTQIYHSYERVEQLMEYFGVSRSAIHHRAQEWDLPVKHNSSSHVENQIAEFVRNLGFEVIQNDRSVIGPREIDIWVPERAVGIEYDGIYYHSSKFISNNHHHLEKTEAAEAAGAQLVHVFSDEWETNNHVVTSRLQHILGVNSRRIFARKTYMTEISPKTSNWFMDNNHIQGACPSSVRLGLYYEGDLVAVMTFGKPRFSRQYDWELIRYATLSGTTVVGGASKLLKQFRTQNPGTLVSYADRRWSQGNLYQKLGFKHSHDSGPNYFYVVGNQRQTRNAWQKHKLKGKLELFDENLTEVENMKQNGYYRIFDCGNSVWTLD